MDILNKLDRLDKINKYASVTVGIKPYQVGKGRPLQTKEDLQQRIFDSTYKKDETYKRYLVGSDIKRFIVAPKVDRWISYGDWLAEPRPSAPFFNDKKILVRQTSDKVIAAIDSDKYITLNNIHNITIKPVFSELVSHEYLLGILNSNLVNFYLTKNIQEAGKPFAEIKAIHLKELPFVIGQNHLQDKLKLLVENAIESRLVVGKKMNYYFMQVMDKYVLKDNKKWLSEIVKMDGFTNTIDKQGKTVGRISVGINDTVLTIYCGNKKREIIKFNVNDYYKRQYLKLYLENLTEEQLAKINQHSGNILDKVLQITIHDYDKPEVVRKVVNEWNQLQAEIEELEKNIEATDKEIDQMVYELYGLSKEDIDIIERADNGGQ
jgi:hypothetical protein